MKLISFTYTGPDSGITLNVGTEQEPSYQDVLLRHGQRCELPDGHPAVATLQAQGYLTPAPAQAPAAVPVSETNPTTKAIKGKE